jgi:hypothetical protein
MRKTEHNMRTWRETRDARAARIDAGRALGPVQKLVRVLARQESVIPLWQDAVFPQTKLAHLFVGDFDTGREVFGDEMAFDGQSCGGDRFIDEFEDQRVVLQRDAGPVFADFAEESVFDGIPLGSAGGVVTDGDREPAGVHQAFLQRPLPGATPIAIAAPAIGQNEQMRVRPVQGLSLPAPPVPNGLDGELRGVS